MPVTTLSPLLCPTTHPYPHLTLLHTSTCPTFTLPLCALCTCRLSLLSPLTSTMAMNICASRFEQSGTACIAIRRGSGNTEAAAVQAARTINRDMGEGAGSHAEARIKHGGRFWVCSMKDIVVKGPGTLLAWCLIRARRQLAALKCHLIA